MKTNEDEIILTLPDVTLHVYGEYIAGEYETRDSPGISADFEISKIELIKGDVYDLILSEITLDKIIDQCLNQMQSNFPFSI